MFFDGVIANRTHIVTVAADGFEPFSKLVFVEEDLIAKVDVSLQPIAGATAVTTTLPPATTVSQTTLPVTSPPVPTTILPVPTRSGLDVGPVLGALVLCGVCFLFRKNRK